MILQSLVRLAERQGQQAEAQGQGIGRGYDARPVHWIVDIERDGRVQGVSWTGHRPEGAKKDVFLPLVMPKRCGRTSGVAADLLVDNAQYLFGIGDAGKAFKAPRVAEAVTASIAALNPMSHIPEVAAQKVVLPWDIRNRAQWREDVDRAA
jgi:hypothetical protein